MIFIVIIVFIFCLLCILFSSPVSPPVAVEKPGTIITAVFVFCSEPREEGDCKERVQVSDGASVQGHQCSGQFFCLYHCDTAVILFFHLYHCESVSFCSSASTTVTVLHSVLLPHIILFFHLYHCDTANILFFRLYHCDTVSFCSSASATVTLLSFCSSASTIVTLLHSVLLPLPLTLLHSVLPPPPL